MGGNTSLKKNLSAWLAKENILALGKWLREYFKVSLTPRWAFLQLSQCCHKMYFSWTKHSKAGVHTEFPQSFLLWSLPVLTPRQMMVRLLLTEKGSEALSFIEARQAGLGSHTSLVGMQVAELQICFRPLTKVPWQFELCWQPPLKGKESVRQERWNMFHCHPPHSLNGWPSISPSATFPCGEKMEELSLML